MLPIWYNDGNIQKLPYGEHVYLVDRDEDWYKNKENKCSENAVQTKSGMI